MPNQSGMHTSRFRLRGRLFPCRGKAIFLDLPMRQAFCGREIRRGCAKAIRAWWMTVLQIPEWRTNFERRGVRRNDLWLYQPQGGGRACLLRRASEYGLGVRGLTASAY